MVCFGRAVGAKDETEKSAVQEELQLAVLSSMAGNNGKFNASSAATEITTTLSGADATPNATANTLTGNYKEYNYSVDANGTVTITVSSSSGGGETTGILASEVLRINLDGVTDSEKSQYVVYKTGTGENILCRVLYDVNDSTGLELVSVYLVSTVTLGYGDPNVPESITDSFERSMWSYNNAISTLNNKAKEYLNTTFSPNNGARCIGSNPNEPNSESGNTTFPEEFSKKYDLKDADENNNKDETRLNEIDSVYIPTNIESKYYKSVMARRGLYWLASRATSFGTTDRGYGAFSIKLNSAFYGFKSTCFFEIYSDGTNRTWSDGEFGFRPVFRLKDNVEIVDGDGTFDNPYLLGV